MWTAYIVTFCLFVLCTSQEACDDITGSYIDGASRRVTLEQTGCSGVSSVGWTFTVTGSKATMESNISGSISGQAPYTIEWADGAKFAPMEGDLSGAFLPIVCFAIGFLLQLCLRCAWTRFRRRNEEKPQDEPIHGIKETPPDMVKVVPIAAAEKQISCDLKKDKVWVVAFRYIAGDPFYKNLDVSLSKVDSTGDENKRIKLDSNRTLDSYGVESGDTLYLVQSKKEKKGFWR